LASAALPHVREPLTIFRCHLLWSPDMRIVDLYLHLADARELKQIAFGGELKERAHDAAGLGNVEGDVHMGAVFALVDTDATN
jgi:hypothetical protein